ncbi:hypothetical protein [Pseudalkalibacillus decolorationis]|uniref:hypothetical protein n=1 Tax=Pseudalkalibacillus decolorationis TaxID=163879 RepID=UPI002148191D|nr:hypothetical protein [Pseudalkalibacillus decolorationis]
MNKDDFKHLKQKLDSTIFSENPYTQSSEYKIIQRIQEEQQQTISSSSMFGKVYKPALSVIGMLVFCSFLFLMINENRHSTQPTEQPNTPSETPKEQPNKPVEELKDQDPAEDEKKPEISKQEIYDRMLNASTNFDTASGTYTVKYPNPAEFKIDFAVRNGAKPAYYVHKRSEALNEESLRKGKETIQLFHEMKEYSETQHDREFIPHTVLDLEYIYPRGLAERYLKNFDEWSIVKQMVLDGANSIVIKGSFTTEKGEKRFVKVWAHRETGIWLKFELLDGERKMMRTVEMNSLTLNESIKESQFTLAIPKEYTNPELERVESANEEDNKKEKNITKKEEGNTQAEESPLETESPDKLAAELTNINLQIFNPIKAGSKEDVIKELGEPIEDDPGTPQSDDLPSLRYNQFEIFFKGEKVRGIILQPVKTISENELLKRLGKKQIDPGGLGRTYSYSYQGRNFKIEFHFRDKEFQFIKLRP